MIPFCRSKPRTAPNNHPSIELRVRIQEVLGWPDYCGYPLVNIHKLWNIIILNWTIHYKWPLSITNYVCLPGYSILFPWSVFNLPDLPKSDQTKCPYHAMQCPYWIQHFQPDFPLPHIVPSWMAGDPPQMSSGRIGPIPNVWVGECCWRWPCTLKQACNTKWCDMICKMRERERDTKKTHTHNPHVIYWTILHLFVHGVWRPTLLPGHRRFVPMGSLRPWGRQTPAGYSGGFRGKGGSAVVSQAVLVENFSRCNWLMFCCCFEQLSVPPF